MDTHPNGGGVDVRDPELDTQIPDEELVGPAPDKAPPPVLERLRAQYAAIDGEGRRTTLMIVPGRYGSSLAMRAKPIPWSDQRRRVRKAMRGGDSAESELNFAASVIVEACEEILIRAEDGAELCPMQDVVDQFAGTGPVGFDTRLCQALGIDPAPDSEVAICRLVFRNPAAMNTFYGELDLWLREGTEDEEDDEVRPT